MDSIDPRYTSFTRTDSSLSIHDPRICGKAGVAILYRRSLSSIIKHLDCGNDRIIGIKVQSRSQRPLFIFSVYMPACNDIQTYSECLDKLSDITIYYQGIGHVMICGDMNASLKDDVHVNEPKSNIFKRYVNDSYLVPINLTQLSQGPSFTFTPYKTCIDYCLSDVLIESKVTFCKVFNDEDILSSSDHLPIHVTIQYHDSAPNTPKPLDYPGYVKWYTATDEMLKSYSSKLDRKLEHLANLELRTADDIENAYLSMILSMQNAAIQSIPKTKYNPYTKPYWSKQVKDAHTRSRNARSKWIQAGRPHYPDNESYRFYKECKNSFRSCQRQASEKLINDGFRELESAAEIDIRLFWYLLKIRKTDRKQPSCVELKLNGGVIETPQEVTDAFAGHYETLYTPDDKLIDETCKENITSKINMYIETSKQNSDNGLLDSPITEYELNSAIKLLKRRKAAGTDMIQNEYITHGGRRLELFLTKLFNAVLTVEYIPNDWRKGLLIPIFKGKGKCSYDMCNYRPVSLLNTVYKLFERVCERRLRTFSCSHPKVFPHPYQHGFQSGLSCITASYCLQETIDHNLAAGSDTHAVFLDTKAAYDTVRHDCLFTKLYEMGINGKLWRILLLCYKDIQSSVVLNGCKSKWFPIRQGVRQGGVSSGYMYLAFINELLCKLESSNLGARVGSIDCSCPTLADDITLVSISPKNMQNLLLIAERYAHEWGFQYNIDKSVAITFSTKQNKRTQQPPTLHLNNNPLKQVKSINHLGITLSHDRNFITTIDEACKRGRKSFYSLAGVGVRAHGLNPLMAANLYRKIVLPSALYGCETWSNITLKGYELINKFQHLVTKTIQGQPIHTRSDMTEAMLNLPTIASEINKRKLVFLQKLATMSPTLRAKQLFIFKLYAYLANPNVGCGFTLDKIKLLKKYNLNDVLQSYVRDKQFPGKYAWKSTLRKHVNDQTLADWQQRTIHDKDFIRFRELNIPGRPAILWTAANTTLDLKLSFTISKLWVTPPNTEARVCTECEQIIHTDIHSHMSTTCLATYQLRRNFLDDIEEQFGEQVSTELSTATNNQMYIKLLGKRPLSLEYNYKKYARMCIKYLYDTTQYITN